MNVHDPAKPATLSAMRLPKLACLSNISLGCQLARSRTSCSEAGNCRPSTRSMSIPASGLRSSRTAISSCSTSMHTAWSIVDRLFDAESVLASKRNRRILRARIRRPQLPGAPGQPSRPARARIPPRIPGRCYRRSSRSRSRSRSAAGARTSSTPPERPVPLFRLGRAKRKAEHVLILLVCMPWNFLAVWNLDRVPWP